MTAVTCSRFSEFLAFREQNHAFEGCRRLQQCREHFIQRWQWDTRDIRLTWRRVPCRLGWGHVTTNTFDYYGVFPLSGRGITQEDGNPGAPPVFVMNYRLWQEMFHGDPSILEKASSSMARRRTLVGIMPPRFQIYGAGVWLPIVLDPGSSQIPEGLNIIGSLKQGVSLEAAAADLTAIARGLAKVYPGKYPVRFTVITETLVESLLRRFKTTLYALLVAVSMLLLIACTNVASLLLAVPRTRQGEVALRASLGASRTRLTQQFLVEALVLASAGCILGCILAYAPV